MKIKFNTSTRMYDLYRGETIIDSGDNETTLARKHKMYCVFYDGTFMHLSSRR